MSNIVLKSFVIILFLLKFSANVHCQVDSFEIENSDTTSNRIFNPFYDSNEYDPYLFYDDEQKSWNVFVPEYSLRSSIKIQSQNLFLNDLSNQSKWFTAKDELESFKLSLNILRGIEYKNRTKYDLGEFGKYLGLSRNIIAIILAVLSLMKK
jgi:hypothetical protein